MSNTAGPTRTPIYGKLLSTQHLLDRNDSQIVWPFSVTTVFAS